MTEDRMLVAIIDDDQDDLEIMEHVIKGIDPNIECHGFVYPQEALDTLMSTSPKQLPDYLFIDINMPGLRGDKCLQMLRSNSTFEGITIVMYSTSMPDNVAADLKNSGANYVFEKPVRIKAYSEIIASILQ